METYNKLHEMTYKLIKHHRTDLTVHDKKTIQNNPNKPFLHITRDLGTTMILLDDCSNTEELNQLEKIVKFYLNENPLKILYYNQQKGFKRLSRKQTEDLFRNYKEREKRKAKIKAIEEDQANEFINY